MKKSKLILGIVSSAAALMAMTACDVTYLDGVILTYTDAQGNRVDYTAEELFRSYQKTSSVAETDFELIKEVLIRKYYELDANSSIKAELVNLANSDVDGAKANAKQNAGNNGTTYEEELESILEEAGVDNIDEYYEKCLYDREEARFETDYYTQDNINAMRDGEYSDGTEIFPESEEYGIGDEGYLKERMPYHVSHILVDFDSATDGDHTGATISEAESKKVAQVVEELAGADTSNPSIASTTRMDFGSIATDSSDDNSSDTSSANNYGDLGIMDLQTEYIQEFKLGLYAFEALYNQENQSADSNAYGYENKDRLLPSEDAVYQDGTDDANIIEAFENRGIGVIPYGVFAALGNDSIAKDPDLGYEVNDNEAYYYARNVLFNKYLNNHQVAVIVPNRIATNDLLDGVHDANYYTEHTEEILGTAGDYTTEDFVGEIDSNYAALPGFQYDTTSILGEEQIGQNSNVLTDQDGKIILVARGGGSNYQGIHFITITRSALSEYGVTVDTTNHTVSQNTAASTTSDVTTLSEYYTMSVPTETSYPKYDADGDGTAETAKSTYVNQFRAQQNTYQTRADTVKSDVMGYNDSLDTYIFQELIEGDAMGGNGSITFADEEIGNLIKSYIKTQRQSNADDVQEDFDDDWQTYAEYLESADEDRALNSDGSQALLSEIVALTYTSTEAQEGSGLWGIGGACYDGK